MPSTVARATYLSASAMIATLLLFSLASSVLRQAGQSVVQPSMLGVASVVTPTQWLLFGGSQQGQGSQLGLRNADAGRSEQLHHCDPSRRTADDRPCKSNFPYRVLAVFWAGSMGWNAGGANNQEEQAILYSQRTDPNIFNGSRGNINPNLANDPLKMVIFDTQSHTWTTTTLVPASASVTQTITERVDSVSVVLQDSLCVWVPPQWISPPPQGLPNPFPDLTPLTPGTANNSTTLGPSNSSSASSTPIAAIVGGVVGGVVLLAVGGILLYRYGLPARKKPAHAPVHTMLPVGEPPQPPMAAPAAPIAEEPY
ncbi:hypothetical protein BDK51DRAFT_38002 [Blyttiomyces helicus]|uniref:Uncharacterized protein n=1 Tax=Blyttiomyces helicus TaxID=388810 RepID=A0A4P9W478_9FUNG|nr:hypothetical protein BDK51DRAFT_38002 [Blyttiomyces helicus]|eukprot:RKO86083.1 hypothetical protein BDK51DRAFT_38002 [Blyttiomyces helicus]